MANNIFNNRTLGSIDGNTFASATTDGIKNVSVGNQNITGLTNLDGYNFQQSDVAAGQYVLNADGAGYITFDPYTPGGGGGLIGPVSKSSFKSSMLAGTLVPGTWYNIYATSSNVTSGAERVLTTVYDLFVFATGTQSISQSGKRRMRVPKQSLYSGTGFYGFPNYYPLQGYLLNIGDIATVSNWVYVNTTGNMGTLEYTATLDMANWDLVPIEDSTYYETRVYDILMDTNPSVADSQFLIITQQSDERSNVVVASGTQSDVAINIYWLNGNWQNTCDFNEWNNPLVYNNKTSGIWANDDYASGRPTSVASNHLYYFPSKTYNDLPNNVTPINAQPWIVANTCEYIGANEVKNFSITGNIAERMYNNIVRGFIKDNTVGDTIMNNTIYGNDIYLSGIVSNTCYSIINNIANCIDSNTLGGGYSATHIKDNVVNGGAISYNLCNAINGNIVTGDIALNENTGAINFNRISGKVVYFGIGGQYKAIYNNLSTIGNIEYNDVIAIWNNG